MEKGKFDFEKVGKRLPYTAPTDLFVRMEERVWEEARDKLEAASRRRSSRPRIVVATMAVAASLALMLVLHLTTWGNRHGDSFRRVEAAFANLSHDDQTYLLQVYEDDLFMHE